MSETAPEGIGDKSEKLSLETTRKDRLLNIVKGLIAGFKKVDANPSSIDFTRQRGVGQEVSKLSEEKEDIDGMTPRQQVNRKLEELKRLNKDK